MRVKGAKLEYSADGNAWTAIADLDEFDPTSMIEATYFDNTTLDAPGDTRREEPGEWKLGESSGSYLHKASTYEALETVRTSRALYYWRYSLPKQAGQATKGDQWTARGYLQKNSPPKSSSQQNQRAMTNFTIKWAVGAGGDNDLPTYAKGS